MSTTIIESGLDIPTANTLIVERADQLGLAQAYQIRGRVGRSRERAFAYLLYPSAEALTEEAAARLSTLADHTELGSGFRIAMRDLEIRGAGNLLGDEQSGHVAAVGFELYCQMIDEAVAEAARRRRRRGRGGAGAGAPRRRRSTPTCPPTTSPSRRRRSTSTAASPRAREPGELRALARRARATASARCRRRSRTCSRCSGRGSSSACGARERRVPRRRGSASPGRARLRARRRARRAGRGGALRIARRHPDACALADGADGRSGGRAPRCARRGDLGIAGNARRRARLSHGARRPRKAREPPALDPPRCCLCP